MKHILVVAVSLSLSLAGLSSVAVAQDKGAEGISTNADGSYVKSTAGPNPTAGGDGGTIVYGDITTGPGYTVIGPPSVSTAPAPAPVDVAPEPVVETVAEPAPETVATDTAVADTAVADTAVATETDADGDNYPDAAEYDLGLDPANIDTDADGAADGDELNIYGTDPTVYDSDGDGVSDGSELFDSRTDPLVWDDFSAAAAESTAPVEATTEQFAQTSEEFAQQTAPEELAQDSTEVLTATDGNAAALGTGNASAAPGTVTRDSSGTSILGPDGRYNVSEVAPPSVSVAGDTDVISPPANMSGANTISCANYGSWYDAQVFYEAAGMTDADASIVSSLDPDYDGIACEEGM